jgi:predicted HAD superfamily Cof-like phosphohydrolase
MYLNKCMICGAEFQHENKYASICPDCEGMTLHYHRVKKFMQHAGQDTPNKPTVPGGKTAELRARLVLEEAFELVKALGVHVYANEPLAKGERLDYDSLKMVATEDADLVGVMDGCADLSVVNIGTLIACGVKDADLICEVDENNLLKFRHVCPECGLDLTSINDLAEVVSTVQPMTTERHEPGMMKCRCGCEFRSGYRREDGKWVKPENHPKPNIAGVLKKQEK